MYENRFSDNDIYKARKTGSFKKDSSGKVTEYDKYGRKVVSYK